MAKRLTLVARTKARPRPERFACRRCSCRVAVAELSADGRRSSVKLCDDCRVGLPPAVETERAA